jgi:hypothetical protein
MFSHLISCTMTKSWWSFDRLHICASPASCCLWLCHSSPWPPSLQTLRQSYHKWLVCHQCCTMATLDKGEYLSSFSTTSEPDLHSSFKPLSPSFSSGCSFGTHANHLHHLWQSASRRISIISSVTQRRSLEQGHRKDPTRCCQPWLMFWRCLIPFAGL